MRSVLRGIATAAIVCATSPAALAESSWRGMLLETVTALCANARGSDAELQTRLPDGVTIRQVHSQSRTGTPNRFVMEIDVAGTGPASLRVDARGGGLISIWAAQNDAEDRPLAQVHMSSEGSGNPCGVNDARRLERDGAGTPQAIVMLDGSLADTSERIDFNPPVPPGPPDTPGMRVAHVDSGVNYLLPEIAGRLARDASGEILGYDFWDDDARPFDLNFGRSPLFPIRHGTAVSSILLREAPDASLVPLRFPRFEMTKMGDVVRHAAATGARVVAMPMGSRDIADWESFLAAARAAPQLLFIVSAGNNGIDIDADPLYPAASDLDNMLVVTSADDFGRLARGSNWGAQHVDLLVPAESVDVTDHRGATVQASGSSYAVPRVAALAVRLLAANPDWTTDELIAAIAARAVPGMDRGAPRVRLGWLPDPAAD